MAMLDTLLDFSQLSLADRQVCDTNSQSSVANICSQHQQFVLQALTYVYDNKMDGYTCQELSQHIGISTDDVLYALSILRIQGLVWVRNRWPRDDKPNQRLTVWFLNTDDDVNE